MSQTVTFFWVLSDFLSGKQDPLAIAEALVEGPGDACLAEAAEDSDHDASDAALWMLLLLRLTAVASDQRLELRKSTKKQVRISFQDAMLTATYRCHSNPPPNLRRI